jgi:hypothetical protein
LFGSFLNKWKNPLQEGKNTKQKWIFWWLKWWIDILIASCTIIITTPNILFSLDLGCIFKVTVYNKDTQYLNLFDFNQFSSGGPSDVGVLLFGPSMSFTILSHFNLLTYIGCPHQLFAHNNNPISLMDKTRVHNAQCIIVYPISYLPPYSIRALCQGPNLDRLFTIWGQWHINILSLLEQACCITSKYEHKVCISIFCNVLLVVPKTYTLHFAVHLDSIHFWGIGD